MVWKSQTHVYNAVEVYPHEPLMKNHFYVCSAPESGDGETLKRLIDFFCPATAIDCDLIKAMLATPFWGGPGGASPIFLITSESGRGKGKSSLARMAGRFCGGHIDIGQNEDVGKIKERLLTSTAAANRVVIVDNVKSHRFSWSEFEALVTSPTVSGRKLYAGDASRPNTITYILTMNGPALSTDLAQRSVIIELGDPVHSGNWQSDVERFAEENHDKIIADILGFLRSERRECESSRFGLWDRDILQRLPNPSEVQSVIQDRKLEVDSEADDSEIFETYVHEQLARLSFDVDVSRMFIPTKIAAEWYNASTLKRHSTSAVGRIVKQMFLEGGLQRVRPVRRNDVGRGFEYVGKDADADAKLLHVQDAIDHLRELNQIAERGF